MFVIIDLQPTFGAHDNHRVVLACYQEARRSMQHGLHIACIENSGYSHTVPSITNLLKTYDKSHFVDKMNTGANQIDDLITVHNLPKKIRVGGIYAGACVYAFVQALAKLRPDVSIEVIRNCVSNMNLTSLRRLEDLPKQLPNVALVY